jgi:transposase-like protein
MNNETTSDARPGFAGRSSSPLGEVIQIDQNLIKDHLDKVVVQTVEDTLNALLDAEADHLCGAKRYEHSAERADTRAGHYERQLHTKVLPIFLAS